MCCKVYSWLFVIPPALFEDDSLSVGELSDFLGNPPYLRLCLAPADDFDHQLVWQSGILF